MRLDSLAALLLLLAGPAQADLVIQSQADNPRAAAAMQRMQAAAAGRSQTETSIPTLEQLVSRIELARRMSAFAAQAPTFESPSRPAIEHLGCRLATEAPSGIERKDGGLNGVLSVYACGAKYVVTYEYTYAVELTQRVRVLDDDFAKHADPNNPLIKTTVVTKGERRVTYMRWLNRKNEIRYEVYADGSHVGDQTFEERLKSVLSATTLGLSKG